MFGQNPVHSHPFSLSSSIYKNLFQSCNKSLINLARSGPYWKNNGPRSSLYGPRSARSVPVKISDRYSPSTPLYVLHLWKNATASWECSGPDHITLIPLGKLYTSRDSIAGERLLRHSPSTQAESTPLWQKRCNAIQPTWLCTCKTAFTFALLTIFYQNLETSLSNLIFLKSITKRHRHAP